MAASSSSLHTFANTSAPVSPRPSNFMSLGFSDNDAVMSFGILMDGIDVVAANSRPGVIAAATAPAAAGAARKFRLEVRSAPLFSVLSGMFTPVLLFAYHWPVGFRPQTTDKIHQIPHIIIAQLSFEWWHRLSGPVADASENLTL